MTTEVIWNDTESADPCKWQCRHLGQSSTTAPDHFSAGDRFAACLVSAVTASGFKPGC